MTLKVEQRLDEKFFTECVPRIYSTGVYLVPIRLKTCKGEDRFVWVVDQFEDESFDENGESCSPIVYSCKKEFLLINRNNEE